MFYLRSFGLKGRILEIDFKVELIKQLLNRIDLVHAKDIIITVLLFTSVG